MKKPIYSLRKTTVGLVSAMLFTLLVSGAPATVEASEANSTNSHSVWQARSYEDILKDVRQAIETKQTHYVVKKGDTLDAIAKAFTEAFHYQTPVKWEQLKEDNHIADETKLAIGTKIVFYADENHSVLLDSRLVQENVSLEKETIKEISYTAPVAFASSNETKVAVETTKQELTKPTLTTKENTKVDVVEPTKTPLTEETKPKAETPTVDMPTVEETKTTDVVEEPKVDMPAVDKSTTEETKPVDVVEQPKAETPIMDTPAVEETKTTDVVNQPEMETPKVDTPATEENKTVDVVDQPEVETPKVDAPATEENETVNVVDQPEAETPKVDAPATEENETVDIVDQPEIEDPEVDAPKTEENETVDVVDQPETEAPAVDAPTTEEHETIDVVDQPETEAPAVDTPTTEENETVDVVDQPEMETPAVDAPTTEKHETVDVVDQPEVEAPAVDTPTTEETETPTIETPEINTPSSNSTRGQRFNAGEILDLNKTYDLFFNMVNNARTAMGIHPLERSTLLQKGTDTRSKELADVNNITPPNQKPHTRPDGSDYSTAFKYTGLSFTSGEALTGKHYFNKTLNQMEDPETVASYFFEKWKNSPAHYELLLDEDFYSGSLSLQANEDGTDDHTFVVATYVGSGLTDAGFEKINTILDKYNYREFIDRNELGFDHETEVSETLEEDYKSHAIELGLYTEPANGNGNTDVEGND